MSNFQFNIYEEARVQERKIEENNAKRAAKKQGDIYDDSVSTYRIFSRAFCNFVFPRPMIKRPFPREDETIKTAIQETGMDEDILDVLTAEEKVENIDGKYELEDLEALARQLSKEKDETYEIRIKRALRELKANADKFLTPEALQTYSPKFLHILKNIQDPKHRGLNLIYSQFRTLEGIGILKLVLETNGFAHFKISKNLAGEWKIAIEEEDRGKPTFALYTGTESSEEKEIIRNIFNGKWDVIPVSLAKELEKVSSNNLYGEIIKVLMITASGAEGISLLNVRYVHITEPYWHPIRIEQVIGRARRICSHKDLPKELQTVEVFLYLMKFTKEQMTSEANKELRNKDRSKIDNKTPLTSDQALYEISVIKENINKSILKTVKESSIDCTLYSKENSKENLQCFIFGNPDPNKLAFQASISNDEKDNISKTNKKKEEISTIKITYKGIKYAYEPSTNKVYDYQSVINKNAVQIGTMIKDDKTNTFIINWI